MEHMKHKIKKLQTDPD